MVVLESEADETAVSEEGSSSNMYICEDGESRVKTNKAGSEPERDYDDHDVAPLVQIVRTRFLANAR